MNSIELRRYVMQPGRRDDLIDLFEREFIESQEECGMTPIGHFRDHEHPDTFLWLRGFPKAEDRKPTLAAFYERSPAWKANRDAANATMIDSDDVLMLRPLFDSTGIDVRGLHRPQPGDAADAGSPVAIAQYELDEELDDTAARAISEELVPALERCARRVAVLVTDTYPNEFPRLPVRDGCWLVVVGTTPNAQASSEFERLLQLANLPPAVRQHVTGSQFFRLEPAARSLYR